MRIGFAALALAVMLQSGCAVAWDRVSGKVVWGVDVGKAAETTNEGLSQGLDTLTSRWGLPVGVGGGLLTLVTGGIAAYLKGANKGWMEREEAAATQQPLPVPSEAPSEGVAA